FFAYKDKFCFVLALTSNPSAKDFEMLPITSHKPLYQVVAESCAEWNKEYQTIGLVVGATQKELLSLRKAVPDLLFLVPGVGKQGGSYESVVENGKNLDDIVLVNISRALLYVSSEKDYTSKIRNALLNF
ncbi:MAG: orotidine 5'-phosphate decarboxylase, partial [Candidatus Margulisbacteria bacterium]|nr:orotidine 5'-phosphate decarboxylase [Candidatus Margulisiibacteriota bacterium]